MKTVFKSILVLFLIVPFNYCYAQKAYSIWYKYYSTDTSLFSSFGNGPNVRYSHDSVQIRTLFNDTLIYSYYIYDKKDKYKNGLEFGDNLKLHAIYYNKKKDEIYSLNGHLPRKKTMLQIYRVPKKWEPYWQKKQILGYDCESVFMSSTKTDSTIIFYTNQLQTTASPFYSYFDVPGVVLQIIEKGSKKMVIVDKIDEKAYRIVMPNAEIMTEADLREYFENKKRKQLSN